MEEIKLIVGLGNPGPKYHATRHNLGFLTIDHFLQSQAVSSLEEKFDGTFCEMMVANQNRIFLKPQSFMNRSGVVVKKFLYKYSIEVHQMLVIHDEADLEEGVLRLKRGGGAGGHNGLRSIFDETGSQDFYRLRVGTGKSQQMELASYLLAKAPLSMLEGMAKQASQALETLFNDGFTKAQQKINQ